MDQHGPTTRVLLDVEDDDQRQTRIQSYLEKLNSSAQTTRAFDPVPQFDFGDRSTFPVKPNSELLTRVQAFLPQMQASNTLLSQRMQQDPTSVDIEHVTEGMDQYIEMNLGLGVFEDRPRPSEEDSEMSTSSSSEDSSDSSDKPHEEDDSDADSDASSLIITSFVPARPIKPLPKRANKRPEIIVLDEKKH